MWSTVATRIAERRIAEDANEVQVGGANYVYPAATLLAQSFTQDKLVNFILPPLSIPSLLSKYFTTLLKGATLCEGIIAEVGDWKACGVLVPPGCRISGLRMGVSSGYLRMMLWEVGWKGCRRVREIKDNSKLVPHDKNGEEIYYLFQIATHPSARRKGYCILLLRHFQQLVLRKGKNNLIWLEATSEAAVRLYKKEGWAIVGEVVIGKGKCDVDGKDKKDGEGFKLWVMVWWPAKDYWGEMGTGNDVELGSRPWMEELTRTIEGHESYEGSEGNKKQFDRVMC